VISLSTHRRLGTQLYCVIFGTRTWAVSADHGRESNGARPRQIGEELLPQSERRLSFHRAQVKFSR